MRSRDSELIANLTRDINAYLDHVQRHRLLWADVDGHIVASHIAESLGDKGQVCRHLQTVTRLLLEIRSLESLEV